VRFWTRTKLTKWEERDERTFRTLLEVEGRLEPKWELIRTSGVEGLVLDDQAHPGDAVHAPASASLDTSGSSASVRTLRDDLVAGRIRHESGRWFDVAEEDDADHEGAWRPIRAHDAEEAAERYAEEVEDGCDWPGEDGNTMDLVVRDIVSKREKRFTVAASLEWSYSARERSSQSGEGSRSGSSEVSGAPPQDPKRGPR